MIDINSIKGEALKILMAKTFIFIEEQLDSEYRKIARKNAKIYYQQVNFFNYNGIVYPAHTANGVYVRNMRVNALTLHYSLISEFECIGQDTKDLEIAIKNYFIAILDKSQNNLILDTFLPDILKNELKHKLGTVEYQLLDRGFILANGPKETKAQTKQHINEIKEHYQSNITAMKSLLMDQFLLRS